MTSWVVLLLAALCSSAMGRRFGLGTRTWAHWEPHHRASERGEVVGTPPSATNATTHFFTRAVLDHAAPVGLPASHWSQRFYLDQTFWSGDGSPIFLYIGGEGPQGPVSPHLFMFELARDHGALIVALEHRFYGMSFPTPNMSTENLRYLSSEQALGDLARFRNHIAGLGALSADSASSPTVTLKHSPAGSAWVAFGGSYPGALSAWVKTKYPALFVGTVASSAPVQPENDFEQYAQVVGAALNNPGIGGSAKCYSAVTAGVAAVVAATVAGPAAVKALPGALQPCNDIGSDPLDRIMYFSSLFGNFQGAVQYNLEANNTHVSDVCAAVLSAKTAIAGFAAATALFSDQTAPFAQRCQQSNWTKDSILPLQNITFDGEAAMRQWIWQSCNEFGFFQTTTGKGQPFEGFAIAIAAAGQLLCQQAYGLPDYTAPNTAWAATNYGGRKISATNVTIPNGSADPWHALGVVNVSDPFYDGCTVGEPSCTKQSVNSASDMVVFIKDTAHCRDMYARGALDHAGISDTDAVVWAHNDIAGRVAGYLK